MAQEDFDTAMENKRVCEDCERWKRETFLVRNLHYFN